MGPGNSIGFNWNEVNWYMDVVNKKLIEAMSQADIDWLLDLVGRAGQAIMRIYDENSNEAEVQTKADQSPLTKADLLAHQILYSELNTRWPSIPILSEEGEPWDVSTSSDLYWAVDPLDGTKEFIKRNGEFTVNVALVMNGYPILGVVGVPAKGTSYLGVAKSFGQLPKYCAKKIDGEWSELSRERSLRSGKPGCEIKVVMSRSHASESTKAWLEALGPFTSIERGSSLKFCSVAEGEADVYPRLGPTSIWDTAAGHAVLNAVGGVVVREDGVELNYSDPSKVLNPFFIAWG